MSARIVSVGSYAPPRIMSNDELAGIVDTSDEWIFSHTGIKARHIAADDVAASDLAVEASVEAIRRADIDPGEIDLVLLATSTPDYPSMPATASIVQERIGASRAGAMDLVAACSGFIYGLSTATAFINAGQARTVLVVGSEVYSKIIDWSDRNTCVLFGDGAGAVIVREDEQPGIRDSVLHSMGRGATSLYRPAGGTREPATAETEDGRTKLQMEGRRVYNFAVQAIADTIEELLERNDRTIGQIDHIVAHQANVRILDAAAKRAGYPQEIFFKNIAEYANTSAASIPIALREMEEKRLLERGQTIVTVGFGSGLSYGGNLIEW
ncbi:MAG: beta-ketoacyl-ACP synthase III [Spirochaetota bacterium]